MSEGAAFTVLGHKQVYIDGRLDLAPTTAAALVETQSPAGA